MMSFVTEKDYWANLKLIVTDSPRQLEFWANLKLIATEVCR